MRERDKKVIRIGDKVEIINPVFIDRVGYPLSFNQAYHEILESHKEKIESLYNEIFPGRKKFISPYQDWQYEKTISKMAKALAYKYMKEKNFGGDVREIHTFPNKDYLKGLESTVIEKAVVLTGVYQHGSPPSSIFDDDGEYPILLDQKTHIILYLDVSPFDIENCQSFDSLPKYHGWIEACNVKKIFPGGIKNGKF